MYLKPCNFCPHKGNCELELLWRFQLKSVMRQQGLVALPKGDRLTTVVFTCAKRLSTLPPGQRVRLTLTETGGLVDFGYGEADWAIEENEYAATVMRPQRDGVRILVWLDEATKQGRNPIAVRPNRVTPLDEPLRVLCSECRQPEGTKPLESRGDAGELFFCPKCAGLQRRR